MNFKELLVWQKSVELAKIIYTITKDLPKSETYGLSNQLQRCSVSIASNIAEGQPKWYKGIYSIFRYGLCFVLRTGNAINNS